MYIVLVCISDVTVVLGMRQSIGVVMLRCDARMKFSPEIFVVSGPIVKILPFPFNRGMRCLQEINQLLSVYYVLLLWCNTLYSLYWSLFKLIACWLVLCCVQSLHS